jgi:hypothetical protein
MANGNGKHCAPPKTVTVKGYWRTKPRGLKKAAAKRQAALSYVVRNARTGAIVSRHRTSTAAVRERKRLDLISYRQGKGRPYETGRT